MCVPGLIYVKRFVKWQVTSQVLQKVLGIEFCEVVSKNGVQLITKC